MNKRYLICMFLLTGVFILFAGEVYAQTTGSAQFINRQLTRPTSQSIYSQSDINLYWPQVQNPESCFARQDILLQVPPGGCQPDVVRSDLLAEQDVPVFCQVDALSINPLINIESLEHIEFTGEYPAGVVGATFHPARAALRSQKGVLGSPVVNNIGYVVVILAREEVETALPELVKMNLTARITYDADKAFGVGRAEFYLQELSDTEFQIEKNRQTFGEGQYSVRLDLAEPDEARISIYAGDSRFVSVDVQSGEKSRDIFLPNSYCQAGFNVHYDGLVSLSTRATLEVDGDTIEVVEGSRFLNGKCRVSNLVVDEFETGFAELVCGSERLKLRIDPLVAIQTGDDIITTGTRLEKNLGGNGLSSYSNLFKAKDGEYAIAGQSCEAKLISEELEGTGAAGGYYSIRESSSEDGWDLWYRPDKSGSGMSLENDLVSRPGEFSWAINLKNELIRKCTGAEALPEIIHANADVNDYFDSEKEDASKVASDFPFVRAVDLEGVPYYAQRALEEAIATAAGLNKKATEYALRKQFVETYPDSPAAEKHRIEVDKIDLRSLENAGAVVNVDNRFYNVRLVDLIRADEDSVYAEFSFQGERIKIGENGFYNFITPDDTEATLFVRNIDADRVGVTFACPYSQFESSVGKNIDRGERIEFVKDVSRWIVNNFNGNFERTLRQGETFDNVCGEKLTLIDTQIDRVAKVRIIPHAENTQTITDLTVGIGIEKRAIELNPEKSREKIDNLQENIEKWDSISSNLGEAITGLKTACFATAGALTVKNFFTGLDGSALARQKVMRDEGGWNQFCSANSGQGKQYVSKDACFLQNAGKINEQVDSYADALQTVNQNIDRVEVIESEDFFGRENVNTAASAKAYTSDLLRRYPNAQVNGKPLSELISPDDYEKNYYTFNELREIELNLQLQNSGNAELAERANGALTKIGQRIGDNVDFFSDYYETKSLAERGVEHVANPFLVEDNRRRTIHTEVKEINPTTAEAVFGPNTNITHVSTFVVPDGDANGDVFEAGTYVLGLREEQGGSYSRVVAQKIDGSPENSGQVIGSNRDAVNFTKAFRIGNIKSLEAGSYKNRYDNPEVKYYESGGFSGLPAIVPFDTNNGWYAATKPTLPAFNNIGAFDSSGRVRVFWVCNVGENGREQFQEGFGDDICQRVDLDSGQQTDLFPGLSTAEAQRLISRAEQAIYDAANQFGKKQGIRIGDEVFDSGLPAAEVLGTQCQDFMSPEECSLLFNTCDPVICPSSRCNLGGHYPVADVVQTGVVGSALLCLPNSVALGGDVVVPVCLTGIKAGIDGYNSILKSHQQCLQENLDTGRTVGICDEITSVYTCEFFWRQAGPIAESLVPALFDIATGNSQSGGGEYLSVQSAFDNAQGSVDFFTQSYATNSLEAFQARSVTEAGSQFCQAFISAKAPNVFETLVEADSPEQFHAFFSEIPFNDATVPPTGQYKVFFHIFSGDDQGTTYNVYMKDPPESSFFGISPTVSVASGYIPVGQFHTDTIDFTAPSGYKQLCVSVNGKEQCGFKQVTTSFAVNYLRDSFVQDELTRTDIDSEAECISGEASAISLLNPNIQAGAEEALNPEVYRRGIVRICSSLNPGTGTDELRYSRMGHCGDPKIGCWLDQKSVDNAITDVNQGTQAETLAELEKIQQSNLEAAGFFPREEADGLLKMHRGELYDRGTIGKTELEFMIGEVELIEDKLVYNTNKANALLLKVEIYAVYLKSFFFTVEAKNPGVVVDDSENFVEEYTIRTINGERQIHFNGKNTFMRLVQDEDSPLITNVEYFFVLSAEEDPFGTGSRWITVAYISDSGTIALADLSGTAFDLSFDANSEEIKTHLSRLRGYRFDGGRFYIPGETSSGQSLDEDEFDTNEITPPGEVVPGSGNVNGNSGNTKYTLSSALQETRTRSGSYSDNKNFIDALYSQGLLTSDEYIEINGEGLFNLEENMDFVLNLLIEKESIALLDDYYADLEDKASGNLVSVQSPLKFFLRPIFDHLREEETLFCSGVNTNIIFREFRGSITIWMDNDGNREWTTGIDSRVGNVNTNSDVINIDSASIDTSLENYRDPINSNFVSTNPHRPSKELVKYYLERIDGRNINSVRASNVNCLE